MYDEEIAYEEVYYYAIVWSRSFKIFYICNEEALRREAYVKYFETPRPHYFVVVYQQDMVSTRRYAQVPYTALSSIIARGTNYFNNLAY